MKQGSSIAVGFANARLTLLATVFIPAATSADPVSSIQPGREVKVTELRRDLRLGLHPELFDAFIPAFAKGVAPKDPTWNPTHPRWASVCALIAKDLHEDTMSAPPQDLVSWSASWNHALDEAVPEVDLDQLLTFLRSRSGQRYREFERLLQGLASQVIMQGIGDGSNTVEDLRASSAAPWMVAARKRLLDVEVPVARIRLNFEALPNVSVVTSYEALLRFRGPELDSLVSEFLSDLSEFEAFVRSPAMRKVIDARKLETSSYKAKKNRLPGLDFLGAEQAKHAPEWLAVYRSP